MVDDVAMAVEDPSPGRMRRFQRRGKGQNGKTGQRGGSGQQTAACGVHGYFLFKTKTQSSGVRPTMDAP